MTFKFNDRTDADVDLPDVPPASTTSSSTTTRRSVTAFPTA